MKKFFMYVAGFMLLTAFPACSDDDSEWRKRSIPTHLERHNPPTIIAKMGLKRA